MLIPKEPEKNKKTHKKWFKAEKLKKVAKKESLPQEKEDLIRKHGQSNMKETVLSYACTNCKHSFSANSLRKEIIESAKKGSTLVYCPKCGLFLVADRKTKIPSKLGSKINRNADLTAIYPNQGIVPGYVPNTWVDRALLEKICHELGKYAESVGMFNPQLKFQRGIRGKVREGSPQNVKYAEYTIESVDNYDVRFRVIATAGITPIGKVIISNVFRTLDGREISFTQEGVEGFVSGKVYGSPDVKPVVPQIYYKERDPSRFREIVASKKTAFVKGIDDIPNMEFSEMKRKVMERLKRKYPEFKISDLDAYSDNTIDGMRDHWTDFGNPRMTVQDWFENVVDTIDADLEEEASQFITRKKTAAGVPIPGQQIEYQGKIYTVDTVVGDTSILKDETGLQTAPVPNLELNIQQGGSGLAAPAAPITAPVAKKIEEIVKRGLRDEKTLVPFTESDPDYSVAKQTDVDPDFSTPYEKSDQGILEEKDRAVQQMFRGGTSVRPTKSAAEIRWQRVKDEFYDTVEQDTGPWVLKTLSLESYVDVPKHWLDALRKDPEGLSQNFVSHWAEKHSYTLRDDEKRELQKLFVDWVFEFETEKEASLTKTAPEKADLESMVQKCMRDKGWEHAKCMNYVAGGVWHRKGKVDGLHPGMHGHTKDGYKFVILDVQGNEIQVDQENISGSFWTDRNEWEGKESPQYVEKSLEPGMYGNTKDGYKFVILDVEGDTIQVDQENISGSFWIGRNEWEKKEAPHYLQYVGKPLEEEEGEKEASIKKIAEPTGYHETDETGKQIELSRLRTLVEDYYRAGQFPPDFDYTKVMSEVSRMTRKQLLDILDKKLKDTHYPVVHAKKKTAVRTNMLCVDSEGEKIQFKKLEDVFNDLDDRFLSNIYDELEWLPLDSRKLKEVLKLLGYSRITNNDIQQLLQWIKEESPEWFMTLEEYKKVAEGFIQESLKKVASTKTAATVDEINEILQKNYGITFSIYSRRMKSLLDRILKDKGFPIEESIDSWMKETDGGKLIVGSKGKSSNQIVQEIRKADLTEKDIKKQIKDEEEGEETYNEMATEVVCPKAEKALEDMADDEAAHAEKLEEIVLPAVEEEEEDTEKEASIKTAVEYDSWDSEELDNGWTVIGDQRSDDSDYKLVRVRDTETASHYKTLAKGYNVLDFEEYVEEVKKWPPPSFTKKKTAQEEVEEEKPKTEYKELKTKPHKPELEVEEEAIVATPEMQKTFHEIQNHKQRLTEIKALIEESRRKVEEEIRKIQEEHGAIKEASDVQEGIEKLAALVEQAETQIVDLGEFFAHLDTSIKEKKFKPSDAWRVQKLLEKFGKEAETYLDKAEKGSNSLNTEVKQRILTVFPKREGSIEKEATVFDAIRELGENLWSYVKSLSEISAEGEQLELVLE